MKAPELALVLAAQPGAVAELKAIDDLCAIFPEIDGLRAALMAASPKDLEAALTACEAALKPAPPEEVDDELVIEVPEEEA
jgi:hypothetical protein